MKSETSLKSLYKKILKDCQGFLGTKTEKSNEEVKKKESEALDDELITCEIIISFMEKYKNPKIKSQFIPNSISKYISEIKNYIYSQNNFGDSFDESTEYDIYRAYGLLWSLRYVLNSAKIEEISNFNFKDYTNFAEFLKLYGNSKKLSKNYRKNFIDALGKLTLNENFVYSWIKKLKDKKLSPIKSNTNNIQNESKITDNNITDKCNDKTSVSKEADENKFLPKNAPICSNNSQINIISLKDNQSVLLPENNKQSNIFTLTPLKDNHTVTESESVKSPILTIENINQNNNIRDNFIQNELTYQKNPKVSAPSGFTINVDPNKIIHSKDTQFSSYNSDKNGISNSQIINENISNETTINANEPFNQNIIIDKKEPKNIINNLIKEDIPQENSNQNEENSKEKSEEGETKSKELNMQNIINILTDKNRNLEKDSVIKNSISFSNEYLINFVISLNDKVTSLNDKVISLNNEVFSLNDEVFSLKSQLKNTNKRVLKLEINQCLMYHQLALYDNSRDLGKSICFHFFEYLNSRILSIDKFGKLKTIINCLEGKIENEKAKNINPEMRVKLVKFFKFHFFINKVINKIMHRNISEECQSLLDQQKEEDILPLFPGFNFSQCFESLEYFVDKSLENPQVQIIMKYVYDNMYKNDSELENIYDENKIVIIPKDDRIKISLNKNDIKSVKNYFEKLELDIYNRPFAELCNEKSWDKE